MSVNVFNGRIRAGQDRGDAWPGLEEARERRGVPGEVRREARRRHGVLQIPSTQWMIENSAIED